ncbi:helix-turn-helix domain-containing protein [Nocardia carnea]|uniref:helix-turn-helix domain-containing protein n=1 Tax=Nocardia carnea TaxID=37328 RepID=UPI0024582205|nr:helix-turn-helix domain-containing protein [Nocardia carnea]
MARRPISLRPASADALAVLGTQIRTARHERNWTAAELADRTGISVRTVLDIESGKPGVAIGNVFNAATTAGVALFGVEDREELARIRRRGEERLALLPRRVRHRTGGQGSDDFDF